MPPNARLPNDPLRQLPATLILVLMTFACAPPAGIEIAAGQIRQPPAGVGMTAAYAVLVNHDSTPRTVVDIQSPVAEQIEIHETRNDDGMMRMRRVARLDIGAGETLAMKPGGHHLMLFGVTAVDAAAYPVTFLFADGATVTLPFEVIRLGAEHR